MVANDSPPDLDLLREQVGNAILEARTAEAITRQETLRQVEAAIGGGASFEEAVRRLGITATSSTVKRWLQRWRSFGLAGLVDQHRGPLPQPAPVHSEPSSDVPQVQLAFDMGRQLPQARVVPRGGRHRGAPPSPLLKWAGSKVAIVHHLASLVPLQFARYHEPFVGGGALFFALRPTQAALGDCNAELVNLYQVVRDEPEALIASLTTHENTREHYYSVRGLHPDALRPVERAARTLFLNRTCYNGLYRVNRHGLFNVPYGSQDHSSFFQPAVIRDAHRLLRGVNIRLEDFEACTSRARTGDFIYLDPPYAVGLNEGAVFKYQAKGFGELEQRRVADVYRRLHGRGCLVMLSNADCKLTRQLYADFEITSLLVRRRIGSTQERRGHAAEIVVRNYTGRRGTLPGL